MEKGRKSVLTKENAMAWHPQKRRILKVKLFDSAKINSENLVLDAKTKAEIETRVAVHIQPEEREELFKQEGVTRNQYTNPTILHRITNFLEI
jgi:hypothetical protein